MRQGQALLFVLDLAAITVSYLAAFLIRFEFSLDPKNSGIIGETALYVTLVYVASAYAFSVYRSLYHYASVADHLNILKAVCVGGTVAAALVLFLRQGQFPRSVLILHPILAVLGMVGVRFVVRFVRNYSRSRIILVRGPRNVLLVGAGDMGESMLRHMLKEPGAPYRIVGFIDDDKHKHGMHIHGYRVLGGRGSIQEVVAKEKVDEVVVAVAARRGDLVGSVMEILRGMSFPPELKVAPSLEEMLAASREGPVARKVRPADLLNRNVTRLDEARLAKTFGGKTVLVTGAGGTIGLELSRQVLAHRPAKLVLLENHATSLFYCESEIREAAKEAEVIGVLGDVRDPALLARVFGTHSPHVVLHAAAHKHVYQLEFNVQEGIANNVVGTHRVAEAARKHGAEVFLLVSTDKAVNPAGVMGATKRAAELVVQSMAERGKTVFTAVRFGNVLGSSGSVLRIFQQQIENGGPVTVTDENVTRYFMTVEEAVGLILQAVSLAKGGEVFVLKMGTPVRIMDMAKNLVSLSGLVPGKDIEIRVTELKQGEKMDEELVEDAAGLENSDHPDIMVLPAGPARGEAGSASVETLVRVSEGADASAAVAELKRLVPSFNPAKSHS